MAILSNFKKISLISLFAAVFCAIGYAVSLFVPSSVTSSLLRSAVFPLISFTVSLAFFTYKNYSEVDAIEDVSYKEIERISDNLTRAISSFWPKVFVALIAILILGIPSALMEKSESISNGWILLSFCCLGGVLRFIFSMCFDNEEMRKYKQRKKQEARKNKEKQEMLFSLRKVEESLWIKEKEKEDLNRS